MDITSEKICFVCEDSLNSQIISYQHSCGKYDIHQQCLDNWVNQYGMSCIICRQNIIHNSGSDDDSSYDIETGSNRSYSPILNDDQIIELNNRKYCNCIEKELLYYLIFVGFCIFLLILIAIFLY